MKICQKIEKIKKTVFKKLAKKLKKSNIRKTHESKKSNLENEYKFAEIQRKQNSTI